MTWRSNLCHHRDDINQDDQDNHDIENIEGDDDPDDDIKFVKK